MVKRTSPKRLSSVSQSASKSIDTKARKRIEELYELTDEIINAYNEINEKYINQIYRKYKQLQDVNRKLREQLNKHHCTGCKCPMQSNNNEMAGAEEEEEEDDDDSSDDEDEDEDYDKIKKSTLPASTTDSVITRSKKKNPFIISDIEDTQNFDDHDSRLIQSTSDDEEEDEESMDTTTNPRKTTPKNGNDSDGKSDEEVEDNGDEDSGMSRLPLDLQQVIKKKAKRNIKDKAYLLNIPRYPTLCEFLRDKSRTSFDHRPSEDQIRPLIANCLAPHIINDKKARMRVRDELREIHRSYMRTFMPDPRGAGAKSSVQKTKQLLLKTSPA